MIESKNNQVASVWKRILSALIDYVLFCGIMILIGHLFGKSLAGQIDSEGNQIHFGYTLQGPASILLLLCWLLIFPIAEGLTGFTLAKKIVGLKVIRKDSSRISILNSFVRHLFDLIDFFCLMGFIIAANNQNKQRMGDLVANTIVIDEMK